MVSNFMLTFSSSIRLFCSSSWSSCIVGYYHLLSIASILCEQRFLYNPPHEKSTDPVLCHKFINPCFTYGKSIESLSFFKIEDNNESADTNNTCLRFLIDMFPNDS